MTEHDDCESIADSLAELAAGAASGPDRARVLRHVAACPSCRRDLEELSRVAADLLLLAAPREPRAGFEGDVLAAITADSPPPVAAKTPRSWRRIGVRAAAVAASAAVVGGLAAGAVWQATESDRTLGQRYRETLQVANGRYFTAKPLTAPDGSDTGTAFAYQGEPSWLMVLAKQVPSDGPYEVTVVTWHGRALALGTCEVVDGSCSVGSTIDVDVSDISEVRLTADGSTTLVARF